MKIKTKLAILCIALTLIPSITSAYATAGLLTIHTDKPSYSIGQTVTIFGTLTGGTNTQIFVYTFHNIFHRAGNVTYQTFVNINPDGSYSVQWTIPNNPIYEGSYTAVASQSGTSTTSRTYYTITA